MLGEAVEDCGSFCQPLSIPTRESAIHCVSEHRRMAWRTRMTRVGKFHHVRQSRSLYSSFAEGDQI